MAGQGPNNYGSRGYNGGRRDFNNNNRNFQRRSDAPAKPHVALDAGTYVDTAEAVITALKDGGGLLTTSKIRNLLSMISSLYDEVRRARAPKLSREEQERIQYIRLHFAYEAGRDGKVKAFVREADILAHIRDIGDDKKRFLLFCNYMEALVAYHRFNDGKE